MAEGETEFRHETERLILRDWREEDWPPFWLHCNTPSVMRWLGGVADASTIAAASQRIEGYRRAHGHTFWLLERKRDGGHLSGEILGFCGLKRANVEREKVFGMMEVGWRLREDAWGRGYAKEAAIASLDLGFEEFGRDEIVALTVQSNAPSWGLMKALGMRRREELDFEDSSWSADDPTMIVYSLNRAEWDAQRG